MASFVSESYHSPPRMRHRKVLICENNKKKNQDINTREICQHLNILCIGTVKVVIYARVKFTLVTRKA